MLFIANMNKKVLLYQLSLLFFTISIVFFLIGFYYLSGAIDCYVQMRRVGTSSKEQALYIPDHANGYKFTHDVVMTPEKLKFQTHAGRIYLYLRHESVHENNLKNLKIEILRDSNGLVDKYYYDDTNFEQAGDSFQKRGFYSFALPPIAMYSGYNELTFDLHGITLVKPEENVEIFIFFNGHKGQTIYLHYLIKGIPFFCLTVFFGIFGMFCKRHQKQ